MRKILGIALVLAAFAIFFYPDKKEDAVVVSLNAPAEFSSVLKTIADNYRNELGFEIDFSNQVGTDLIIASKPDIPKDVKETISITDSFDLAVNADCKHPAEALRFGRYLVAPQKGAKFLTQAGVKAIPGDVWAKKPELILYSGGVNRPAVEALLQEFIAREGIELTTVFNGCGILCAAMKTMSGSENNRFPDAYFACDLCFVPPVQEHFSEVILLTETDIGICVPKGNPNQIKTLIDLAKPDLRVGLCNQKQSTLGYMTQGILKSSGLEKSIRKNASVEVPTADFLITQMRSGALDAAIVYRVNAELQKEHIEFIKINHEGAKAVQPFSIRSDSDKKQLAGRLQDHFLAHPEAFEETGFTWRGDEGPVKSSDIEIPDWLLEK